MQKSLGFVWRLRIGSFCSTMCLSVLSFTPMVLSRRRYNRVKTRTKTSPYPTVYIAYPRAFEIAWISHHLVVVVFSTAFFAIGLVYTRHGGLTDGVDPRWMRSSGDLAVAVQLYHSLYARRTLL
ncbi:hypothetical protein N657DRAFT_583982 [Parathielavia appendiculata]|uniref:Uncharacterized protein n=1 Tax=Parathielavia appendiculata TaxID=2587402 RepID=A0AAN6TPH2_9PEZI|nr:hypothetical protein N657DRAFT_583982 [Parathielavia appendiculata]